MEFTIKVARADETGKRLERLSQRIDSISRETAEDRLRLIAEFLVGEVKKRTPKGVSAGGGLEGSIFQEVRTTGVAVEAIVSTPLVYGPPVEFGSEPHFPPSDALKGWAKRKLGDEKLAYVVARAISRRGTKPQEMFQKAWDENLGQVQSLLAEIGLHVSRELLKNL